MDWYDVVRRLLHVYGVRTQAELSMAMGIPVEAGVGDAIETIGLPWQVLAKAASEKDVDWNWLMTGEGKGPAMGKTEKRREEQPSRDGREKPARPPRVMTRALIRELIEPEGESRRRPATYTPATMPVREEPVGELS